MAALQNTLHVSEYSLDGKFYASISYDGKLKIWDTETSDLRQEFVPQLHLTVPFTCLTWINVDHTGFPQKSPKKQQQKDTTPYIVLGGKNGTVSLYSFAKNDIESILKGKHEGEITGICRGTNDSLFTCSDDGRVIMWSLKSAQPISTWEVCTEKPTSLVYLIDSNRLMVAGRQLYLWSIENEQIDQTFTGHQSQITFLRYIRIKTKEFILSTAKSERVLNLWRMKISKKNQNSYSYIMEDVAYNISCRVETNGYLKLAAVTRSGVLHLYSIENLLNEEYVGKSMRPTVTIEIANDTSQLVEPIPIITATLESMNRSNNIRIGYGDRQRLRFECIEPDFNEKRTVLIRSDVKKSSIEAKKKTIASFKSLTPEVDVSKVDYQTTVTTSARKGLKTVEIPMETRLENLTFGTSGSGKQAKNVSQLLIQALHSHDVILLRTVFTNNDEQIIRSTLQRLPPQYVGSLVKELTSLAQKKSSNAQKAVVWLKHLVQTHTSQLMAIGNIELYSQFGPLLGIIEHRMNSLQHLSKLSGRLDLLVNQIKQNIDRDEFLEDNNLLVYEDQDTSESDVLANGNEESSDDQWEEDADEEENGENDVDLETNGDAMDGVEEESDDSDDSDED